MSKEKKNTKERNVKGSDKRSMRMRNEVGGWKRQERGWHCTKQRLRGMCQKCYWHYSFLANFSVYKWLERSAVLYIFKILLKSSNTYVGFLEGLFASFFFFSPSEIFAVFILIFCGFGGKVLGWFTDSDLRTEGAVMFQLIWVPS